MDTITQLRSLAAEVRNYQLERGWTDTRLCKEIASVGSSKTYKRILDATDDLSELNLTNQLRNFQSASEVVASLRTRDLPPELEYEDFDNLVNSESAVRRAAREDEDCVARLVIIEGNTATGKDAVRRHLLKKFPNSAVAVEAEESWRDSLAVPARAIYNALSIIQQTDKASGQAPRPPRYPAEIIAEVVAYLKQRKIILIINEAHHLGPRGLNLVKTLINQTPSVVVLECIPALLTRLLGGNYEEAVQLTGNRLAERVYLAPPSPDEILLMLERRGVKFATEPTRNQAATDLATASPQYGNWRFVSQVTRRLYDATKRGPVAPPQVAKAIAEVKNLRTRILKPTEN